MPQDDFQLKYQSCGHLATPASQPAFLQRMEQPALLSPCTPRGADFIPAHRVRGSFHERCFQSKASQSALHPLPRVQQGQQPALPTSAAGTGSVPQSHGIITARYHSSPSPAAAAARGHCPCEARASDEARRKHAGVTACQQTAGSALPRATTQQELPANKLDQPWVSGCSA